MRRSIIISMVLLFMVSWNPQSQGQEKRVIAGDLYDAAIDLFYREKYEEAMTAFSKIIETFPKSNLVSYSQYMIGQCYLKMGKYEEAIRQYELYLKTYPEGDRASGARSGIGTSQEKLKALQPPVPKGAETETISEEQRKIEQKLLPEAVDVKRRVCAQVFYLDGKNLDRVEKRIKALKESGVNTLIFRVFQNKGDRIYKFATARSEEGVYFKTEQAPVVDDILGKVAEIAHRNGLDIFAWMTTRFASYGLDGHPELHCKSYNFETKKLEVARGVNLFRADVLKRLEGLFRDLGRYPIDGILFQDDLILKHNEDFSTEANKAFFKEFGYSPHPDLFYIEPYKSESGKYYVKAYSDKFWVWANWKNRWLMNVAKQLMTAAKESNPGLKFGINLYYETVLNHSNSVAWFSQTLTEAQKKGFDYYAFMAYHRQTMNELNMEAMQAIDLMAEVAQKAVKSIENPFQVMMKVQVLDWKSYEVIPAKEVETLLDKILTHGEVSLVFVPYIDQFPLHQLKRKWDHP
ncbi:MAG TPA: poly-beta-1,6-N-acetyl-D-glucosamine N-deacetylase PgaB [Thermodesulfobacteriota bacterium]|nr:poly-beta-1,6-N-acetyl-D-glucosamine N-deacetylase PgaB [Thermodesulfobacteriota bacterium]